MLAPNTVLEYGDQHASVTWFASLKMKSGDAWFFLQILMVISVAEERKMSVMKVFQWRDLTGVQ